MNWFFNPVSNEVKNDLPNHVREAIDTIASYFGDGKEHPEVFYYGQKSGKISILPDHFYSPVPGVFDLHSSAFEKSSMAMVEKNYSFQLQLLREFKQYQRE